MKVEKIRKGSNIFSFFACIFDVSKYSFRLNLFDCA